MRIGVVAESLWERLLLRLGLVPTPLAETHLAFLHARAVMAAAEAGVFESLAEGPRSAVDVAADLGTDCEATTKLLSALEAADYVRRRAKKYRLSPVSRKWLLADSPRSVREKMRFQFEEWHLVERLDEFLITGRPVDLHTQLDREGWARYQLAMRDLARFSAGEVVRKVPIRRRARTLLDLGGGHGLFAAAACAAHPELAATVIDLPEALVATTEILAAVEGGDRVSVRAGDARTADFGYETTDVILMVNLAHHLSEAENRQIATRAGRALRPGGVFAVVEWIRPTSPNDARRAGVGALLDLYFALTSRSGTWSTEEIGGWQRDAGLVPLRPRWLRRLPGTAVVVARCPS
jgi:SAM-dependent methyltransferase